MGCGSSTQLPIVAQTKTESKQPIAAASDAKQVPVIRPIDTNNNNVAAPRESPRAAWPADEKGKDANDAAQHGHTSNGVEQKKMMNGAVGGSSSNGGGDRNASPPAGAPPLVPTSSVTVTASTGRDPSPSPPPTGSLLSSVSPTGVQANMAASGSTSPLHLERSHSDGNKSTSGASVPSQSPTSANGKGPTKITVTVPSSSPGLHSVPRLAPLIPSPTAAAAIAAAGSATTSSSPSLRPRPLLPNNVNNSPSQTSQPSSAPLTATAASTGGGSARGGTPSPIPMASTTPSPGGHGSHGHHHGPNNHLATPTPGTADMIMTTTSAGIVTRLLAEARAQASVSTNDDLAPVGSQGPQARHAAERFARAFFQAHSVSVRREVASIPHDQRALWAADRAATLAGSGGAAAGGDPRSRSYFGRASRPVSFSLTSAHTPTQ